MQFEFITVVYEMNEVGCLYTGVRLTNDQLGYDFNWTDSDENNILDINATKSVREVPTILRQCVLRGYQYDTFNTSRPKVYFIRKITEVSIPVIFDYLYLPRFLQERKSKYSIHVAGSY